MSRRCMVVNDETNEKCLGHPPVDDERYPPICDAHLEGIFGWLIRVKAEVLAGQMLTERLMSRPARNRQARSRQPAAALLKPGQHLTEQDQATLDFLRGAA